ncbi:Fc.00g011590.m01.CDS01 [Cosmosporella sp. VM-42]
MSINPSNSRTRNALVTGANGYIGSAVCRAFARAGWRVYGLIRKSEAARELILQEAIPVVGTFTDLTFTDALFEQANTFDAIVSCTEQLPGYEKHFAEVIAFVKVLTEKSNENGVRPLVLWSSGCKDYGTTSVHGAPDLAPHTEDSPLNSPEVLKERTTNCLKVFDYADLFDAAVIRPTSVFGYSSSYYGPMLDYVAAEAKKGTKTLTIPGDPNSIMHATHVDDCAEAYLSLAEHPDRAAISGQAFNISGHRYETLQEVASSLVKEYGFTSGVNFVPVSEAGPSFPGGLHYVFSFSQWVGSTKIRALTGWKDRRLLFSENLQVYRRAYEAMRDEGHGNIAEVRRRIGGNFGSEEK